MNPPSPPAVTAVKIPLEGWRASVWVEAYKGWYDMSGSPTFKNPDDAVRWGLNQQVGWPK